MKSSQVGLRRTIVKVLSFINAFPPYYKQCKTKKQRTNLFIYLTDTSITPVSRGTFRVGGRGGGSKGTGSQKSF